MKVVSVNIGKVAEKSWREGTATAIHKQQVDSRVLITEEGLEGDEQADLKNHGGADKAVLILPSSAYDRFEITKPYGYLGENISLEGLDETEICLGDRLQVGSALLEVTQPRSPCWKLDQQACEDSKWQQEGFLQAYSKSGHVGFYCRVLGRGTVGNGSMVYWLTRSSERADKLPKITIKELFLAKQYGTDKQAIELLAKAVKHPALSLAWKTEIQNKLDRLKK